MKEETSKYRTDIYPIYIGKGNSVEMGSSESSSAPKGRFKHQSFIYKGRIYVHGGTTVPTSDFSDDPLDLYSYDLEKDGEEKWEKLRTKWSSNSKQLQSVSAHAGVIAGNKWYVFGGSNSDCKPNSQLLRLNLDTLQWAKLDQKGDVPTSRQSAFLTFYEKNWLLLYGGLSTSEVDIYNTFHFYNLDTKNWSKCEGTYIYQVYARLDPAICHFNSHLYMFGGTYRNMNNWEKYLDDFYEITVNTPGRNQSGKIVMKRLISPVIPEGRSGHNLVGLNDQFLLLFGGENTNSLVKEGLRNEDISLVQTIWIYNIKYCVWNRLQLMRRNFKFRSMASCVNLNEKVYLFGGIYNYNCVMNDLVEIEIDTEKLNSMKQSTNPCMKCHEKQKYVYQPRSFSASIIDDIAQNIDFPFAAFGLLIDNAMNNGASLLRITYNHAIGLPKVRSLKFEDDARLAWSEEELISSLVNFNAGHMYVPSGMDKKIKAGVLKENGRRQYGYNLKIASLRLGESFVFATLVEDLLIYRIFILEKENKDKFNEKYVLYYYTYNYIEKKVCSPEMEEIRLKFAPRYGDFIDAIILQRRCRNTLLIFEPHVQDSREVTEQNQIELKGEFDNSNIIFGPYQKIKDLEKYGYNVNECVDVSLRAYITCLYLKNQSMKITLSVREAAHFPIQIQTQIFLDKVDRLCKQKHVLEINQAFEFDLKITEIYYLYDLKKKFTFFNNGLLIYHKNRLITRFKYPLGELVTRKYYKYAQNHNFLRLFGFIELPDHIPINIFKTNYIHHVMMEKLFSRLKFINKMFKKELVKIANDPEFKRAAPTRLSEEEILQDKIERDEKPKSRPRARPVRDEAQRVENIARSISLRKRKYPTAIKQPSQLQQQIKILLKEPTTANIQQFIKMFERRAEAEKAENAFLTNRKRNSNFFSNADYRPYSRVRPVSFTRTKEEIEKAAKQAEEALMKEGMIQVKPEVRPDEEQEINEIVDNNQHIAIGSNQRQKLLDIAQGSPSFEKSDAIQRFNEQLDKLLENSEKAKLNENKSNNVIDAAIGTANAAIGTADALLAIGRELVQRNINPIEVEKVQKDVEVMEEDNQCIDFYANMQ